MMDSSQIQPTSSGLPQAGSEEASSERLGTCDLAARPRGGGAHVRAGHAEGPAGRAERSPHARIQRCRAAAQGAAHAQARGCGPAGEERLAGSCTGGQQGAAHGVPLASGKAFCYCCCTTESNLRDATARKASCAPLPAVTPLVRQSIADGDDAILDLRAQANQILQAHAAVLIHAERSEFEIACVRCRNWHRWQPSIQREALLMRSVPWASNCPTPHSASGQALLGPWAAWRTCLEDCTAWTQDPLSALNPPGQAVARRPHPGLLAQLSLLAVLAQI